MNTIHDKEIMEKIKELSKETTECCNQPILYNIHLDKDGEVFFERWDFCRKCLEC